MKKIILLLVILTSLSYCNAQTGNRDSIKNLILNDKEDTTRVKDLANLSYEYIESNPDTMMIIALEGFTLSTKIGWEKGKAISLNRMGGACYSMGNYNKAMECYLQALKINEKIKNLDGEMRNLNNLGNSYFNQEEYKVALDYLFRCEALAEQINNQQSLTSAYANIAVIYDSLKIYDSATLYAERSKALANKLNFNRMIGSSLQELGSINFATGQNSLALEYFRLGIPYLKKGYNDLRLSETLLCIAKVFQKMGQKDSASFYAKQSLLLAQQKGFILEIRNAARFLSYYYRNEKIPDSAFFYQDISRAANDSIFSKQKQSQFQSLSFDEKIRQQELAASELKAEEERKHDLQDAIIVIALITFVILFLLISRSIIVKEKFIEFFGILGLLAVFEFINLFIHPYLSRITYDSHFFMLAVLIAIGALLIPLHHKLEKWITKIMVEKNKKIRLEAAKKTIATLEG